jgi:hypothetical protein
MYAEGCSPLVNDLTGKIAVVYRNTCEFGMKARNAENAGAIGVIILNRDPDPVGMGGGDSGTVVTIPVVMLGSLDGQALTAAMQNGPVEVFMGNRAGLYGNDLSVERSDVLASKAYSIPEQLAQEDGEIAFEVGLTLYNFGYNDQDSAMVHATIEDPNGDIIYDEAVGPFSMAGVDTSGTSSGSGIDSIIIMPGQTNSFPSFTLNGPMAGRYTLAYEVKNGSQSDDFPDDNLLEADFLIGENFAYSEIDANGDPQASNHYRPSGSYTSYSACIAFSDPNAERIGVDGLWFSAAAADSLTGVSFYAKAFQWNDEFVDLDDPNIDFAALEELEVTEYTFASNDEETFIYVPFENDIVLQNDQRYLFCVKTFDPTVFIGFDTQTEYVANQALYRQPIGVVEVSEDYDPIGFEADATPSIILEILDSSEIVIPEDTGTGVAALVTFNMHVYPNPTKDQLVFSASTNGTATVNVIDVTGKVVMQERVNFAGNMSSMNVAPLQAGVYMIRVTDAEGRVSLARIIKE